jgi:hypothetical protein
LEHDPDHPIPGARTRPSETRSTIQTIRYLERSRDHPILGAQSKAKRVPGRNYVFTRNLNRSIYFRIYYKEKSVDARVWPSTAPACTTAVSQAQAPARKRILRNAWFKK